MVTKTRKVHVIFKIVSTESDTIFFLQLIFGSSYCYFFMSIISSNVYITRHYHCHFPSSTDITSYQYSCKHCNCYETIILEEIIEHCKVCPAMPRPNAYKFKFVCFMCNYGAYQSSQIRAHIFNHIGEKPFKCPHCSYASARNSHLLQHMRTKHC